MVRRSHNIRTGEDTGHSPSRAVAAAGRTAVLGRMAPVIPELPQLRGQMGKRPATAVVDAFLAQMHQGGDTQPGNPL